MNLYELLGGEQNPNYQQMAASNNARQYDFLLSIIQAAINSQKPWLSESLIKALNFHAIVGLHDQAGQYRSHEVAVGFHQPPARYRVRPLMEDFVNAVNWNWQSSSATVLAASGIGNLPVQRYWLLLPYGESTTFIPS